MTATKKSRKQRVELRKILGASRSFTVKQKPDGPFGAAALVDEIRRSGSDEPMTRRPDDPIANSNRALK